jgi:hypothetical protein
MTALKFEVLRGKIVIMHGTYTPNIYPPEILKMLQASGHTFRMDGKPWAPGKMENPVKAKTKKPDGYMEQMAL